jgi:hypothetical protein
MYSLQTLTLSNNNLEFYFPKRQGKQAMDAFYDYLTTKKVDYRSRMPQIGHCMSRVFFNIPRKFSVDGRSNTKRPDYANLLPDTGRILFPRHVIYNMATKLGLGGEYLVDPTMIPQLRDSVEASEWMAGKEREILWPLLSNHYFTISESHGANMSTGPELKKADSSSTHIVFVHRDGKSARGVREMLNWEEFRDSLSSTLSSRGYSFQFINPNEMTIEEQVLLCSRATLYVSVHGANLVNIVWMNPRATILEISSKLINRFFFENVAADFNTFYLKYVDARAPLYGNGPKKYDWSFTLDIEKFMETFWVAVYLSNSQFGAPAGAKKTLLKDISNSTAFVEARTRYPKFIRCYFFYVILDY